LEHRSDHAHLPKWLSAFHGLKQLNNSLKDLAWKVHIKISRVEDGITRVKKFNSLDVDLWSWREINGSWLYL